MYFLWFNFTEFSFRVFSFGLTVINFWGFILLVLLYYFVCDLLIRCMVLIWYNFSLLLLSSLLTLFTLPFVCCKWSVSFCLVSRWKVLNPMLKTSHRNTLREPRSKYHHWQHLHFGHPGVTPFRLNTAQQYWGKNSLDSRSKFATLALTCSEIRHNASVILLSFTW